MIEINIKIGRDFFLNFVSISKQKSFEVKKIRRKQQITAQTGNKESFYF